MRDPEVVKFIRLRERLKDELFNLYNTSLKELLSKYPEEETKTFSKQEAEARDLSKQTYFIDQLAIANNVTRQEIASKIISKADTLAKLSGILTAAKQVLEVKIDALTDDEMILFIVEDKWNELVSNSWSNAYSTSPLQATNSSLWKKLLTSIGF